MGYATGFYNRLTSDGTYNYEYDDEGNRTKRTNIATGEVTDYEWDHRNRLVTITDRVSDGGAATQVVSHRYDAFNRWISKTVDSDGDGVLPGETTRYEYDGNQIVLAIDEVGNVTNRYLWGPAVDQLLADEQTGGNVLLALTDHLGT
ncbi:MAG: RHS repeat protein, partial [Pirellulales bacterium]|nr:RHS repeat protein [Pirellulales bacterium]